MVIVAYSASAIERWGTTYGLPARTFRIASAISNRLLFPLLVRMMIVVLSDGLHSISARKPHHLAQHRREMSPTAQRTACR
jgi:hypothetical protein